MPPRFVQPLPGIPTDRSADPCNGPPPREPIGSTSAAGHLVALQQIADENAGNRASPGPGYEASVRYVVAVLSAAGYQVSTPSYPLPKRRGRGGGPTCCHNVIAQTRTGDPRRVVMVGAHLDSVTNGPGINDNGSGVAALLQIGTWLGGSPHIGNAIRFAFWGSEEDDLAGSRRYVKTLSRGDRILLYLNLDMIASPNAGYFVQGGEGKRITKSGPPGSAQVACVLVEQLAATGVIAQTSTFDRESDYANLIDAGIPSAGVWSGDSHKKSRKQARRWGGRPGRPFDPHYHTRRDRLDKLVHTALDRFTRAVASTVSLFALDLTPVSGPDSRRPHGYSS